MFPFDDVIMPWNGFRPRWPHVLRTLQPTRYWCVRYPNNFSHFIFNLCNKNKILRVKLCRLYHFHFTWAQRQNLERGIQLISTATAQCFISYSDAVSLTEKNRESLPWLSKWARWSIIQLWKSIIVSLISIIHFNHGYPWLIIIIHAWIVDIHN